MRRSISLLGAVVVVLFAVGCGPQDPGQLTQDVQAVKSAPILMGASCQTESTCGLSYGSCSEWSAPVSCGGPSSCTTLQYQTCIDASGNECVNVSQSSAPAEGCN